MKDPRYEYEKSSSNEDFSDFLKDFSSPTRSAQGAPIGQKPVLNRQPSVKTQFLNKPASSDRHSDSLQSLGENDSNAPAPFIPEEIPIQSISQQTASNLSLSGLIKQMMGYSASDLHLTAGAHPIYRINGDIIITNFPAQSNEDLERMLFPLLNEEQYSAFKESGDLDFAVEVKGVARFRINYFFQHKGLGAVFRLIPLKPIKIEELGLPAVVKTIAEFKKGLIIVTGPTGSGKTTTLAAMIDHMNRKRNSHIITIEDPLEFVHKNNMCLITHREVGHQAVSFSDALKAAIREDPDVILVGEMRDKETMELAITAAEMGLLVLTTLHTIDAAKSVDRILDTFPIKQQEQIRLVLSQTLKAVIAQQLVKKKELDGRYPAVEILLGTKALSSVIREGKTHQISTIIQTGGDVGMQTMDQSYLELIKKNIIKKETIRHKINDLKLFERAGIVF